MSNLIIIALTERKLKLFFKVTWSWFVTSTYLISLIGCTFLPNFVAIVVVETEMSTLIWVITWIPRKKLNPPRWEILKIRNTNLQFISPGKVSARKDKKNIANCKALCVLHKTQKGNSKALCFTNKRNQEQGRIILLKFMWHGFNKKQLYFIEPFLMLSGTIYFFFFSEFRFIVKTGLSHEG